MLNRKKNKTKTKYIYKYMMCLCFAACYTVPLTHVQTFNNAYVKSFDDAQMHLNGIIKPVPKKEIMMNWIDERNKGRIEAKEISWNGKGEEIRIYCVHTPHLIQGFSHPQKKVFLLNNYPKTQE